MNADLSRRLARAMMSEPDGDERQAIVDAAQRAETFDDLPLAVQALVQSLEARQAAPDLAVVAVRDDGALLITDGGEGAATPAAIVSGDNMWVTLRDAALSRGTWSPDNRDVPTNLPTDLADRLALKRRDSEVG